MAYSSLGAPLFSAFRYSFVGHLSGISFLPAVTRLLRERNLAFNCDAPTEAKGNCFPYAVMQQLHRPAVRSTLSNEVKVLCEAYYNLRKAIVGFVRNTAPGDEYYELIVAARNSYEATRDAIPEFPRPSWQQRLKTMEKNGSWFNEQFMQFTAWFLKRDIMCYTMNATIKFCASSSNTTGNFQANAQCNCSEEPLHIANLNNSHFQSLLPAEIINIETEVPFQKEVADLLQCKECDYSTAKQYNLKRHIHSKHPVDAD